MMKHISKIHNEQKNEIQRIKCDSCDKSYIEKLSLRHHIQSVHEKRSDIKCKFCEKCFCNDRALKRHVKLYHQTEAK